MGKNTLYVIGVVTSLCFGIVVLTSVRADSSIQELVMKEGGVKRTQIAAINVTKCWAESNGKIYVIANGQISVEQCHKLAIKCTGDPNVTSHYNTNPVTILKDFEYCRAQ